MNEMNEDLWVEWKNHPGTKEFMNLLSRRRADLLDAWAAGAFTSETSEGTAQKNAEAIGQATLLKEMMEIELDDFK